MKRLLLLCLIIVWPLSSAGSAQTSTIYPDPPWCPTCLIVGNIDTPAHTATVDYASWYIAGWSFVCETGTFPSRVDVAYINDSNEYVLVSDRDVITGIHRPDVQAAYGSACTNTPSHSGYHITFNTKPPTGTRQIIVSMWNGVLMHTQVRTVTIQ